MRITFDSTMYVDYIGYEVKYNKDENVMGVSMTGELYWHFNGFMLLGVI